jgi:hypothetical protein
VALLNLEVVRFVWITSIPYSENKPPEILNPVQISCSQALHALGQDALIVPDDDI